MADAVRFGFKWVAPGTAWSDAFFVWDENIFGFTLTQQEGQCATLEIEIKNPRIGLLNPSRFQWVWFSWKDIEGKLGTPGAIYPLFFGRLISYPQDLLNNAITIHFEARPQDFLAQKQALAADLMVRPTWDPVFVAAGNRLDPDTVLEGRSAMWHVDRLSLVVSVSHLLVGEDGTISPLPDPSQDFWESVKTTIDKPPLKNVYVEGTVKWSQQDNGIIDMGHMVVSTYGGDGVINGWPKPLSSIGAGWSVEYAAAVDQMHTSLVINTTVTASYQNQEKQHAYGDTMSIHLDWTKPSIISPNIVNTNASSGGHFIISSWGKIAIVDQDPDGFNDPTAEQHYTDIWVLPWTIQTTLFLRYEADRSRTEQVRFTLAADVQPVFTDPGGQAANFAQDSEYVSLEGNVGIEGPYGTFLGDFSGGYHYSKYDYFMSGGFAWQVTRDHLSDSSFDQQATASVWEPFKLYGAGVNVKVGAFVYAVLVSHLSAASFSPNALDGDLNQIYTQLINPHAGPPLYQLLPNFRGDWATATVYVANDIFIGPDDYWYIVQIGHTSDTFFRFNTDPTGRLLYGLLLNPAPIGDLSRASYFPGDRGLWSLEYLIMVARAKLVFRSRTVKVSWDTEFHNMIAVTLRKNASITDHRLPGGGAIGKITSYTMRATEEQGAIGNLTISPSVGTNNTVHAIPGEPDYVDEDYVEPEYQVYTGQQIFPVGASDVLYSPPDWYPIDDGLVFPLTRADAVISETFAELNNTGAQAASLAQTYNQLIQQQQGQIRDPYAFVQTQQKYHEAVLTATAQALAKTAWYYIVTLKPVSGQQFSTEYDVTVSDLMLPMDIDLTAASVP